MGARKWVARAMRRCRMATRFFPWIAVAGRKARLREPGHPPGGVPTDLRGKDRTAVDSRAPGLQRELLSPF